MGALSQKQKSEKLTHLAEASGYASASEMLEACITDSVVPAICTDPDCSYTTEMEPDQDEGWCEACGQNTVASALVLADIM